MRPRIFWTLVMGANGAILASRSAPMSPIKFGIFTFVGSAIGLRLGLTISRLAKLPVHVPVKIQNPQHLEDRVEN